MKLFCKTLAFLHGALALSVVLLAVRASDPALIRIGYQKYGTLNVVRAHGDLDKTLSQQGKKVEWLLFAAGPQLLEALNAGVIEFIVRSAPERVLERVPTMASTNAHHEGVAHTEDSGYFANISSYYATVLYQISACTGTPVGRSNAWLCRANPQCPSSSLPAAAMFTRRIFGPIEARNQAAPAVPNG